MANLFFSVPISIILFLFRRIRIRIYKFEELTFDINFFLFHLILYPERRGKKKRKKHPIKKLKKKINNIIPFGAMIEKLITKSDICIKEIMISSDYESDAYYVRQNNICAIVYSAISYLNAKAKRLYFDTEDCILLINSDEKSSVSFDMTLVFNLFDFFTAFLVFLVKKIRKSGWKIV